MRIRTKPILVAVSPLADTLPICLPVPLVPSDRATQTMALLLQVHRMPVSLTPEIWHSRARTTSPSLSVTRSAMDLLVMEILPQKPVSMRLLHTDSDRLLTSIDIQVVNVTSSPGLRVLQQERV